MSTTLMFTGRKRLRTKERLLRDPLLVLQVEIREKGTYRAWVHSRCEPHVLARRSRAGHDHQRRRRGGGRMTESLPEHNYMWIGCMDSMEFIEGQKFGQSTMSTRLNKYQKQSTMSTRLNKYQKQALARAIIDDLPPLEDRTNDFKEAAVFALKDLVPANILQLWKDGSPYIRTVTVWGRWGCNMHPSLSAPHSLDFETDALSEAMKDSAVAAIFQDLNDKLREREKLERRIRNAVESVSTAKAFRTRFPEFAKYLPEEAQATNLPADANLITDLMQAGWPKEKK